MSTVDTHHGLTQVHADLHQHLRILVVRNRLNNRLGPLRRISRLEDTGAHKHAITSQLHHERRIRRRRNTTRRKVNNRQTPQLGRLLEKLEIDLQVLGIHAQFLLAHVLRLVDFAGDGAHVADRFDDVAGAGFAFCADHGGAFGDAAEGLTEAAAAADEGDAEGVFGDVVDCVGGGENFGFVNVVYA
jgi:hypothetical protein